MLHIEGAVDYEMFFDKVLKLKELDLHLGNMNSHKPFWTLAHVVNTFL